MSEPNPSHVTAWRRPGRADPDDLLAGLVVASIDRAVTGLVRTARVHECVRPAAAVHIRELAERIAGQTLDAIRSWPES